MIHHLEQLIALLSLEYNLSCETLDEKPEYFETHQHKPQFIMDMEDSVTFTVIPDHDKEVLLVYGSDKEALAILKFDAFDVVCDELDIYADSYVN